MYCTKCGAQIEEHQNYCPSCGARAKQPQQPAGAEASVYGGRSELGDFLVEFSYMLTRWFLTMMSGGFVLGCGLAGFSALGVSVYSIYCFFANKILTIPGVIASELGISTVTGGYLLFVGVGTLLIAILLLAAMYALVKGLRWLHGKKSSPAD